MDEKLRKNLLDSLETLHHNGMISDDEYEKKVSSLLKEKSCESVQEFPPNLPQNAINEEKKDERIVCERCGTHILPNQTTCSFCGAKIYKRPKKDIIAAEYNEIKKANGSVGSESVHPHSGTSLPKENSVSSSVFPNYFIVCPYCGMENSLQSKKCIRCHGAIQIDKEKCAPSVRCPGCGTIQNASNKRCSFCNVKFDFVDLSTRNIRNEKYVQPKKNNNVEPMRRRTEQNYNQENEKGYSVAGKIVISVLVFALFFVIIMNVTNITSQGSKSSVPKYSTSSSGGIYRNLSKTDAWSIAIDYVKEQLKAPLSAKYSSHMDDYTFKNDGDTWTISGYIDAQNSFGVYLRSHFETKFKVYRENGKDMVKYLYVYID